MLQYSESLAPSYVRKEDDFLYISFDLDKCVCGIFRKLEAYEPVSKTWCECCNGHVIKTYSMICDKIVSSEIIETIVCRGNDCIFKITN